MGLWTITHFWAIVPAFLIFAGISALLSRVLKDKSDAAKYIPLKVIALLIVGLEIAKQAVSISRGYDLYHLPFHYCSLFLYLLPLHAFSRGKVKKFVDPVTFTTCSSLMLFLTIMPTVVYSDVSILNAFNNFFDGHSLAFHHLVCLYFFIAFAQGLFELELKRDFGLVAIFLSAYVIVATVLSYALEVNFHNLRQCNLGAGEQIRVALNDALGVFGQVIYVFGLFVLTTLFAYLAYFLMQLIDKHIIHRRNGDNAKNADDLRLG